jgi:hypothetical protein
MAAITGAKKVIALGGLGSTFGTAQALGAGDRMEVESFNDSENTTELTANPIGAGTVMQTTSERGETAPSANIEMLAGYNDAGVNAIAQFYGTDTVSTLATGVYQHRFTIDEDFNEHWLTLAHLATSDEVIEYPSCAATRLGFTANPNDFLRLAIDLLGNDQITDQGDVENDDTDLAATTIADPTRVVVRPVNSVLINEASDGALDSMTDCHAVTSLVIEKLKPQEFVQEIRCADGNSEPESAEGIPFQATVTLNFKNMESLDWIDAHKDGTEFKLSFEVLGPNITPGNPYAYRIFIPRFKVIAPVDAPTNSAGRNAMSVVGTVLKAASNPTGMADSYPYMEIVNARATAYVS